MRSGVCGDIVKRYSKQATIIRKNEARVIGSPEFEEFEPGEGVGVGFSLGVMVEVGDGPGICVGVTLCVGVASGNLVGDGVGLGDGD